MGDSSRKKCIKCGMNFTNMEYKWLQLGINNYKDAIFEWIPYCEFNNIKKLSNTTYSARWKDGPLLYSYYVTYKFQYTKNSENEAVILKYLVSSQKMTNEFLNEYFTNMEHKWCKTCEISQLKENFANWTSDNKHIDHLIQEMQLKINNFKDIIVEWIPYYQFNDIKELSNTTHLARWKDGLLYWNEKTYARNSENKAVILKYLINAHNIADEFLNEIIEYYDKIKIYELLYHQFNNIEKLSSTCSAIWKDGLLHWNEKEYIRNSANEAVILKYLIDSQNITDEFLNKQSYHFSISVIFVITICLQYVENIT
ncbi:unnamed protein product [Rhizophagus irregularis]|nr:unnamed protein product [Rhizophagus irregularis]